MFLGCENEMKQKQGKKSNAKKGEAVRLNINCQKPLTLRNNKTEQSRYLQHMRRKLNSKEIFENKKIHNFCSNKYQQFKFKL